MWSDNGYDFIKAIDYLGVRNEWIAFNKEWFGTPPETIEEMMGRLYEYTAFYEEMERSGQNDFEPFISTSKMEMAWQNLLGVGGVSTTSVGNVSPGVSTTSVGNVSPGVSKPVGNNEGANNYLQRQVSELEEKIRSLTLIVNQGASKEVLSGGMEGMRRSGEFILGQRTQEQDEIYSLIKIFQQANPMGAGELPETYAVRMGRWLTTVTDATISGFIKEKGWTSEKFLSIASSVLGSLTSSLIYTRSKGNFPLAAAGYFGVQGLLGGLNMGQNAAGRQQFEGVWDTGAEYNGKEIGAGILGIDVPKGLPNDIFQGYRFCCYDRLSSRWFPSDEIRPLEFDSNENFRWVCLDRVSGNMYKANLIKKARIYLQ